MEDPSSLCNCSSLSSPMEDQKINNQLLKLHPSSSSSSTTTSNQLCIAAQPPEVAQLLGFFNLQTSTINHLYHALQTPSSDPNHHLLPTILPSMINNFNQPPYLMGGNGISPVEESTHTNENSAINSSTRMMGGKRRKTNNNNNDDNDKEDQVIHVRAKRGQATDSHSLAERVRRERINEKLRVLQDLVPGCYKTMGMAVMLDVIINYVRSLQNQIEFLSMKLSSASMFCDFNSPEAEALEALQQRENPCEALEIETTIMRDEGFEGIDAASAPVSDQSLHSTWPF